jgi:hypothetical protein
LSGYSLPFPFGQLRFCCCCAAGSGEVLKEADAAHFSYRRLKLARQVLRDAPTLAPQVIPGAKVTGKS